MMDSGLQCLPGWRMKCSATGALEDCSLIVPTYQRPREVISLLQTITGLPDAPAEVVVVDGSPGKDAEAALSGWAKPRSLPFDLIYVRSPAGLTRQRNVGIDISSREYVYFLDDDCLPQHGYFREIHQVFLEDKSGRVGAVCGSIINEMGKPMSRRWRIRLAIGLAPRGESGRYYPSATSLPLSLVMPFNGVRPVDTLPGCAMAFRRAVFDTNRFSEFFRGYAQGEDLEMSLRISREWKLLWCGDAHVIHNHAEGGRPTSFTKGEMEVRNRFFIWKRYGATVGFKDKTRFWLDIVFLVVMDLAWFFVRPSKPHVVAHAVGVLWAAARCVVSPPHYEEPPARRQYCLRSCVETCADRLPSQ